MLLQLSHILEIIWKDELVPWISELAVIFMSLKTFISCIATLVVFISCAQTIEGSQLSSIEKSLDEAYNLYNEKKYDEAIAIYSMVISRNNKIQLAFYNRGLAYLNIKDYKKALSDFNQVMTLQRLGDFIITYNEDFPFASEEARAQVPYNDALYQRAQVKYHMDSLKSSFQDFFTLVEDSYNEKSNCLLWLGTILYRSRKPEKACEYFEKAKAVAFTEVEKQDADLMIETYCNKTNSNR